MMHDMWKLFPRLVEQKINALLDEAEPNRMKSFQLYKTCQNENLWNRSYAEFSEQLSGFFSLPKNERTKSRFDYNLNRPMHKSIFEMFRLDFRNSVVNSASLISVSSWAHHMLRLNCRSTSVVISIDVMKKTLNAIVNPTPFEKAQDIEFEDFCGTWKRMVFNLFGRKYDKEMSLILEELTRLENEQQLVEKTERFVPGIYLTQTEIDWTSSVLAAAKECDPIPRFPLSRGPQKDALTEIERVGKLYWLVMDSDKPELVQHRQNVRTTLIFRCEELLKKRAA